MAPVRLQHGRGDVAVQMLNLPFGKKAMHFVTQIYRASRVTGHCERWLEDKKIVANIEYLQKANISIGKTPNIHVIITFLVFFLSS